MSSYGFTDDDLIGLRIKGSPSDRNRNVSRGELSPHGVPLDPRVVRNELVSALAQRDDYAEMLTACNLALAAAGHPPLDTAMDGIGSLITERDELREVSADLLAALKLFVEDERFDVAIGGNPNAVAALIQQATAAIAKAEGMKTE
jgi:hypothetical protein